MAIGDSEVAGVGGGRVEVRVLVGGGRGLDSLSGHRAPPERLVGSFLNRCGREAPDFRFLLLLGET